VQRRRLRGGARRLRSVGRRLRSSGRYLCGGGQDVVVVERRCLEGRGWGSNSDVVGRKQLAYNGVSGSIHGLTSLITHGRSVLRSFEY